MLQLPLKKEAQAAARQAISAASGQGDHPIRDPLHSEGVQPWRCSWQMLKLADVTEQRCSTPYAGSSGDADQCLVPNPTCVIAYRKLVAAFKAGADAGLAGGARAGLQGRLPLMPSQMENTPSAGNPPSGGHGYQVRCQGCKAVVSGVLFKDIKLQLCSFQAPCREYYFIVNATISPCVQ